jgi:hypothetical protein
MMFDRQAKAAFIVACLVLVASGFGFHRAVTQLNIFLAKEPVPLRQHFSNIPRTLSRRWQAMVEDGRLDAATRETLGTDQYLNRRYRSLEEDSDLEIQLHIAYYTGLIDAVPHVPDRCLVAGGFVPQQLASNQDLPIDRADWQSDPEAVNHATGERYPVKTFADTVTGRAVVVRMPVGDLQLRTTPFIHPEVPDVRIYAGYLFVANGRTTSQPERIRMLAFDRTDKYAYYCKVQVLVAGAPSMQTSEFLQIAAEFLGDVLPEVMRCLPDWSEVEAGQPGGPT